MTSVQASSAADADVLAQAQRIVALQANGYSFDTTRLAWAKDIVHRAEHPPKLCPDDCNVEMRNNVDWTGP